MASKTVGWTMPPTVFSKLTADEHERVMRAMAIDIGTRLILKTPVDTGRARGGWIPTVNSPSVQVSQAKDPSGAKAIARLQKRFGSERARGGRKSKVIYLTNNVPYIGRLNNGHSQQAPAHFVEMAIAEVTRGVV